jgi:hypothetical protein
MDPTAPFAQELQEVRVRFRRIAPYSVYSVCSVGNPCMGLQHLRHLVCLRPIRYLLFKV